MIFINVSTFFLVVTIFNGQIHFSQCTLTEQQCYDQIYRQCTHETSFTDKEIQTTQLYLQRRFSTTDPIREACPISANNPPCIRKDIKCLSGEERQNLTSAWVELYSNGVIGNYTKIHFDYWGAGHKFSAGARWHFWYINQFEKELQNINPSICLPYWNVAQDFAYPEESIVWDIFGHAGNESNDYCVPDGPFANVTCTYPTPHCLRRQWRINNTITAWKSPEWYTTVSQMRFIQSMVDALLKTLTTQFTPEMNMTRRNLLSVIPITLDPHLTPHIQRVILSAITTHFDTHLSIGRYYGDISVMIAPNDPVFHLFHINIELNELLWQLSNSNGTYLVPKSFDAGITYNNLTSTRSFPNINNETFNYYTDKYVKEGFQFGYGDMCHLYDVIIKPINFIVNQNLLLEAMFPLTHLNYTCVPALSPPLPSLPSSATLPIRIRPLCNSDPLPTAAQRLKNALSPSLFAKYYPTFASNNWSFFDHLFLNISNDCNPVSNSCKQMPISPPFGATPEGQRQYQAFNASIADLDLTNLVDAGYSVYNEFMNDLYNSGYCSPYV